MNGQTAIRSFFASDVGRKRAKNQDNGLSLPAHGLCLVADGMGGHKGGETASRLVAETFAEFFPSAPGRLHERLQATLHAAHTRIYELSQREEALQGMGTTSTCLAVNSTERPTEAAMVHVGDSRCYLIRRDAIWQLTRDHSLVQEKVRAGLIRRDQAKQDLMRNVITRSVGFEPQVQMDTYLLPVTPGDWFLLCSDGLTGQVEDLKLLEVTSRHREGADLEACARELIGLANAGGGDDNISVGILSVESID